MLLVLVVVAGHVSAELDLLERFIEWSRAHEDYELDEILMIAAFGLIGTMVFTVRRIREIRAEVVLREESDTRANFLAYHDSLTELANREHFAARLSEALAWSRRSGEPVAVLAIDLDRFKFINDSLGHAVGDALLRSVAERLRENVRETDTVARMGGDEFAIVQVGVQQPRHASRLAERLVDALDAPHQLDGHDVQCSASIGIAVATDDGDDPASLVRYADTALYRAKADGRQTVRFFEEGMDVELRARRELEQALREGLNEERFRLHFQPMYNLSGKSLIGFEALLRFDHPERGPITPSEFIPLAEESGLIVPLGAWALGAACREATSWPEQHRVAVNLSPIQFRHGDIVGTVREALQESGLPAHRLELEITESLLLEDADNVFRKLAKLRDLGVAIAMDDFGTGYSSLAYLWRFPFDKIKIDQSFIKAMDDDPRVAAIIDSILSLGATLGMDVTAEGIETDDQADLLRRIGCEHGQGYLLGRPVPVDHLESIVSASRSDAEATVKEDARSIS